MSDITDVPQTLKRKRDDIVDLTSTTTGMNMEPEKKRQRSEMQQRINPREVLNISSDSEEGEVRKAAIDAIMMQVATKTEEANDEMSKHDGNTDQEMTMQKEHKRKNVFPFEPARDFPFALDSFQRQGIEYIEKNEDVLVVAHTSAGKTVIAQYAIAKALKNNQRVIYTSPIKALSNQKYRDFCDEFGSASIGLLTGDVSKNREASCVVMTTEILRNMLYQGANYVLLTYKLFIPTNKRNFFFFFLICYKNYQRSNVSKSYFFFLCFYYYYYYFNDRYVCLFDGQMKLHDKLATISNANDFAEWVSGLKNKKCNVIGTNERPVPLEYYVFPVGGNGLYLVKDSVNGKLMKDNFDQSYSSFQQAVSKDHLRMRRKHQLTDMHRLLSLLYSVDWLPVIVFTFSRKEVEGMSLFSLSLFVHYINFCTEEESDAVEEVFNNAIDMLPEEDKHLQAVQFMLPMLKRGIGLHHSGILPILKEITEILFQEGLVKVLFATETFAMGINMPAKSIIFTKLQKFDGEFIQMSGRAGRRGIDKRGFVVLMTEPSVNFNVLDDLMCDESGPLTSSFRLAYNTVLNIAKSKSISTDPREHLGVDGQKQSSETNEAVKQLTTCCSRIIDNSFYHFLVTKKIPEISTQCQLLRQSIQEFEQRPDFAEIKEYFTLYQLKQDIVGNDRSIQREEKKKII
ncbi:ATP-dependent RNA helicase DOB1 [Reticulomyxa filosa]|uniref:ATP-dependent RNA helicase DOB1 n=1 Tax=Reticulomyxa filosa TaxID=46433 RepID=X6NRG4_RETFI|nr:ATP-dependent RNA helicase DOB1 [Reticulomyxa filosa]|eukprot:ETO27912.1 ATP-dependent RNA helicase DOB1 [Reticulomyxa filosa]